MATPQLLSRKATGVLPVSPAQIAAEAPKGAKTKTALEGEKVVIRRLPPGLTEEEFAGILGDDWKVGKGKVRLVLVRAWQDFQRVSTSRSGT